MNELSMLRNCTRVLVSVHKFKFLQRLEWISIRFVFQSAGQSTEVLVSRPRDTNSRFSLKKRKSTLFLTHSETSSTVNLSARGVGFRASLSGCAAHHRFASNSSGDNDNDDHDHKARVGKPASGRCSRSVTTKVAVVLPLVVPQTP